MTSTRFRPLAAPAAVTMLAALMAAAALAALAPRRADAAPAAALRIAVIDFRGAGNVREGDASLGAGLQSMLTTDLATGGNVTVVERARLTDLRKELKLTRSAWADPATALKVGKLAGATHLVTGTFTLVGPRLRLDARVVEVATGRVALATDADGERDAFFELEKKLAGAIVSAIGVTLTPKERASFARIHTADWEAFRQFGDGLRLFDDAEYDRALEALRSATTQDQEFKLARTTLDTYERLAREIRSRASVIEADAQATTALARREMLAEEQATIDALAQRATRKAATRAQRAAALYLAVLLLSHGYDDVDHEGLDRFARERLADSFVARYVREADGLFPDMPMVPFEPMGERFGGPELRKNAREVDKAVDGAVDLFMHYGLNARTRAAEIKKLKEEHLESVFGQTFESVAEHLHLDYRQATELMDHFYAQAARFSPDGHWRAAALEKRADRRRRLLDIAESTRLLKQAAAAQTDPGILRRLAKEVEINGKIAAVLAAGSAMPCVREWAAATMRDHAPEIQREFDDATKKGDLCASEVVQWARAKGLSPTLLGNLPAWIFASSRGHVFISGPQPDPERVMEMRYLRGDREKTPWMMAIVEGTPRAGAALKLELSYDMSVDPTLARECARHLDCPQAGERPTVTMFFDAVDVHVDAPRKHGQARDDVPMRAVGVALEPAAARQVDLRVVLHSERSTEGVSSTARAQRPLRVPPSGTFAVTARREERRLVLDVAGQQVAFDVAAGRPGFLGFLISGQGFVRVSAPHLQRLP